MHDSEHITTINNQRSGSIHQVEICVKARYNGVILDNDPTATEYRKVIPMLRSGQQYPHKFPVTANTTNSIPADEISTVVMLYDSTEVNGTSYGTAEQASLVFTIDIS